MNPTCDPVEALNPYELKNLVAHLEEADREKDIHRLLALKTSEGWNSWYQAKQAYDDLESYIDDVNRAWAISVKSNKRNLVESGQLVSWDTEVRYALIISSISSLVANIPSKMLATLLSRNFWSFERVITYIHHLTNPTEQALALASLVGHVSCKQLEQIEEALGAIRHSHSRAIILSALARRQQGENNHIASEALNAARTVGDQKLRLLAISELLSLLMPWEKEEAIREIKNSMEGLSNRAKIEILISLCKNSDTRESSLYYEQLRQVVENMPDSPEKVRCLVLMGTGLPDSMKKEPVSKALAFSENGFPEVQHLLGHHLTRASTLFELAPSLDRFSSIEIPDEIERLISSPEAFTRLGRQAQSIEDAQRTLEKALAVQLAFRGKYDEALAQINKLSCKGCQAEALEKITPILPEQHLKMVLLICRRMERIESRAKSLAGLSPQASIETIEEALRLLGEIRDERVFWGAKFTFETNFMKKCGRLLIITFTAFWDRLGLVNAYKVAHRSAKETGFYKSLMLFIPVVLILLSYSAHKGQGSISDIFVIPVAVLFAFLLSPAFLGVMRMVIDVVLEKIPATYSLFWLLFIVGLLVARVFEDEETAFAHELFRGELLVVIITLLAGIGLGILNDFQERKRVLVESGVLPPDSVEALEKSFLHACELDDPTKRITAISFLRRRVVKLPVTRLYETFSDALPALAKNPRQQFLLDLCAWQPVLKFFGGKKTLALISTAMDEVSQYWP